MFELDGVQYTNKFNLQKYKTIEMVTKVSLIGVAGNNNGFFPYHILEQVFTLSLVDVATNEVVPQNKALNLFEKTLETYGLPILSQKLMERMQEDLGFLFRMN